MVLRPISEFRHFCSIIVGSFSVLTFLILSFVQWGTGGGASERTFSYFLLFRNKSFAIKNNRILFSCFRYRINNQNETFFQTKIQSRHLLLVLQLQLYYNYYFISNSFKLKKKRISKHQITVKGNFCFYKRLIFRFVFVVVAFFFCMNI